MESTSTSQRQISVCLRGWEGLNSGIRSSQEEETMLLLLIWGVIDISMVLTVVTASQIYICVQEHKTVHFK